MRTAAHKGRIASRALAKVGKSNAVGMCQKESRLVAGTPASGGSANDAWYAARRAGKVVETNDPDEIPANTLVYWTNSRHGHVAPSYARGKVVSTDWGGAGRWAKANIGDISRRWNMRLVGYVLVDGNGYSIYDPPKDPTPGKGTVYKVAVAPAQGRSNPGTGAKHPVRVRKGKGERIRIFRTRRVVGILWGRSVRWWWPMRNLRKA